MANVSKFQSNRSSTRRHPTVDATVNRLPSFMGSSVAPPAPTIDSRVNLALGASPTYIRLNLETLQSFEVVDRQFQNLGVTFFNTIALQPSNPVYASRAGSMVLMGAPKSGWLEVTFLRPVHQVSSVVTSSRSITMVAYDINHQQVAQTKSSTTALSGDRLPILSNVHLSLQGKDIRRVTLYTFDSQLTLDEFNFSFVEN